MADTIRTIISNSGNLRTALPVIGGASSLTVYQQINNVDLSPTALTVTLSGTITDPLNIVVQSATALTVTRAGTNYALQVDTNTANSATGIKITAATAGGGATIAAISSGADEDLVLNAKGAGQINLNNTGTGNIIANRTTQVVVQSATALGVGRTTSYAFQVDTNTAGSITGVKITAAAAAAGVAVAAISTGANENLTIDAKGSGTITLNGTATGRVVFGQNITMSQAASTIIPGATSFAIRNNADTANNLLVQDSGVVTTTGRIISNPASATVFGDAACFDAIMTGTATVANTLDVINTYENNSTAVNVGFALQYVFTDTTSARRGDRFFEMSKVGTWTATASTRNTKHVHYVDVAGTNTAYLTLDGSAGLITAGAALALGANNLTMTGTIAATGARVTQSYHTNITSTNAVTVDSWGASKYEVQPYEKSALDILRGIEVVSFRHLHNRDTSHRIKLGVLAESIKEPLVTPYADYGHGLGIGPQVDTMGLDALNTKSIQELLARIELLEAQLARN